MKLPAAVVLLAASTAYAQAPGETLPEVPAQPDLRIVISRAGAA